MKRKKKIIVFDDELKSVQEFSFIANQLVGLSILSVTFIAAILFVLGAFVFTTSNDIKIKKLNEANAVLWSTIQDLNTQIKIFDQKMQKIFEKDEQLRVALNIPAISSDVRELGVGGAEIVAGLDDYANLFDRNELIDYKNILTRVEKLNKELDFETKSYEELYLTFKKKEDSIRYIPCIKPVPKYPITSRFGRRLHPILKVIRMHDGVDIMANIGTPIYAPADGVVKFAGINGSYGKFIVIDHLKGFVTRYGHLNKINVRIGQKVRRGDKIGEVGNTGLSTGPHLHYEVVYKSKHLDPGQFMIE